MSKSMGPKYARTVPDPIYFVANSHIYIRIGYYTSFNFKFFSYVGRSEYFPMIGSHI